MSINQNMTGITVMRSTLNFMSFCQIWPQRNEELNPGTGYFVKFWVVLLSTLVNLIGSILHLFIVSIRHGSIYHIAEDLIVITAQIGVYYYIIVYVPLQGVAAQLYLKLSTFDKFGKPPDFDRHSLILKYLSRMYKFGLNMVVLAYFLEPMITKSRCEKQNAINNFEDICGLVTASWMPFNIEKFPNKYLFYAWQTYSIYWTYEGSAAISFLIMETMEHLVIRILHLKVMLKEAIETEDDQLRHCRFSKCMEYHIEIFGLARGIDKIYKRGLFVHVFISGILFGIMGYSILFVGLSIKTMSLFVVWVLAAIFSSLSAQRLFDGSISVSLEVYNSKWYERDYKFQKDLIMIMQRSQKAITIHAGPFAEISNVFILTIFKTAYSYLMLLKATST